MKLDQTEMNRAMNQLAKDSLVDDHKIVTMNGTQVLKLIAFETPKKSGFARAGWSESWSGLGITGKPYTRKVPGNHKKGKKTYVVGGDFIDGRSDKVNPSVEFVNTTHIIWQRKNSKVRVNYIFDLNDGKLKSIQGESIGKDNRAFMQKAVNRAEFKFGNFYERRFKKFKKA